MSVPMSISAIWQRALAYTDRHCYVAHTMPCHAMSCRVYAHSVSTIPYCGRNTIPPSNHGRPRSCGVITKCHMTHRKCKCKCMICDRVIVDVIHARDLSTAVITLNRPNNFHIADVSRYVHVTGTQRVTKDLHIVTAHGVTTMTRVR